MTHVLHALLLTVLTVGIHAACTAGTLKLVARMRAGHWLVRTHLHTAGMLSLLVVVLLMASLVEAWVWSLGYVASGAIESAEEALYFSVVTFTTLGYGDVTLGPCCRLLSAMQAAVGIIIFGWSTALVLAAVQRAITVHGYHRE